MELTFRLKKTPEYIFDYLTDMIKFTSVHPVISKIDKTIADSYLVHETLKLGIIPFSFSYPVTIKKNIIDKVVIIKAVVFKLTKIEMKFFLSTENDHTIIKEYIEIKSPLPIKNIMKGIFRKQHTQLFKNIENK